VVGVTADATSKSTLLGPETLPKQPGLTFVDVTSTAANAPHTTAASAARPGPDVGRPLSVEGLHMRFPDGTVAIEDLSLTVEPGEFVTIVGPSGCGKSTLLRIVAGLVPPTAGQVRADTDSLAFVFQDPTLLPWRSVRDNVELFAELEGVPAAERARAAQEAIALVGLEGFEDHLPKRLSGGMRMRTSLARSLTLDPALFLFDEPFGALDEITREHLQGELQQLYHRQRFTALFITHSVYEAIYLSSRVLVMSSRPGRFVAELDVPFPFPRDRTTRFDPAFVHLAEQVSDALRSAHA
jgi:NitT/TauT family transport system ATP-binding protein